MWLDILSTCCPYIALLKRPKISIYDPRKCAKPYMPPRSFAEALFYSVGPLFPALPAYIVYLSIVLGSGWHSFIYGGFDLAAF